MKQFMFRALVTLDAGASGASTLQYPSGTHSVMVHACPAGEPSHHKYFPAVFCRDDEEPLKPGDRALVTITLNDDDAGEYLAPGRQFTMWDGHDIGHGIISRWVFASGPS